MTVTIAGSGLAELTCAWLLASRGHRVRLRPRPSYGPRPLLLGEDTLALLRALWGVASPADGHRLTHRHVRWAPGPPDPPLAHPAVVLDGALLCRRLLDRLCAHHPDAARPERAPAEPDPEPDLEPDLEPDPAGPPHWTVTAEPPTGHPGEHWTAGRRHLLAGEAPLAPGQDATTARLDRTDLAWLHLTPLGNGRALLQAMVPGPVARPAELLGRLLATSELAPRLLHAPETAVALPAAPRLHLLPATAPSTCTPGTLLVGAGAIRYDPLSGTGTAQALRTAILAAALIGSAAAATPPDLLCAYYAARLRTAFQEHLATCARLYPQAFPDPSWQHELNACGWPGTPLTG
ncbi:NAD(P)/FAD-dependent oxidoreductase [Streptomyces sp. NBC_00853]|uniref:hypothetical protein n=1 Tax=Streptomyces sp. NBC_00853 TaxID=2903681 RepID=UPI003873690D|nr:NAD(P)/FAD-dependent oxidoreductase [Streptomyces sp. NBC_00853]